MKLIKPALAGVLIVTPFLGTAAIPAFANEIESVGESKGRVTFILDSGNGEITDPLNPIDPEKPGEPGGPGGGGLGPGGSGGTGPLSIDYISNFDFGTIDYHPVRGGGSHAMSETWVDDGETTQVPNYIQITDSRGKSEGWSLTVVQDGQFSNGSSTLKGAEITLENVNAANVDGAKAPNVSKEIKITLNENTEVAWADQINSEDISGLSDIIGIGTSHIKFGDEKTLTTSVYLDVPGGNIIEEGTNYETELTWTLHNTPRPN